MHWSGWLHLLFPVILLCGGEYFGYELDRLGTVDEWNKKKDAGRLKTVPLHQQDCCESQQGAR